MAESMRVFKFIIEFVTAIFLGVLLAGGLIAAMTLIQLIGHRYAR